MNVVDKRYIVKFEIQTHNDPHFATLKFNAVPTG